MNWLNYLLKYWNHRQLQRLFLLFFWTNRESFLAVNLCSPVRSGAKCTFHRLDKSCIIAFEGTDVLSPKLQRLLMWFLTIVLIRRSTLPLNGFLFPRINEWLEWPASLIDSRNLIYCWSMIVIHCFSMNGLSTTVAIKFNMWIIFVILVKLASRDDK